MSARLDQAGRPTVLPPLGNAAAFSEVLQQVSYDYDIVGSPRELADMSDLVVLGAVESIADGRRVSYSPEVPPELHHTVLKVKVESLLRGDAGLISDGYVYVEVARPPHVSVEDVAKSTPIDRMLLFLEDRSTVKYDGPVENELGGRPPGARIFAAFQQGILVDQAEGGVEFVYVDQSDVPEEWRKPFDAIVEESLIR